MLPKKWKAKMKNASFCFWFATMNSVFFIMEIGLVSNRDYGVIMGYFLDHGGVASSIHIGGDGLD